MSVASTQITVLASRGTLPQNYVAAQRQLAECDRVDECKDIADKMKALASYAKQSQDDSLEKYATRIKARATRRCGELLRETESAQRNGRPSKSRAPTVPTSRSSVATTAGLSERQKKTALRVAAVPQEEFDRQVESDNPPTITELARQGTKHMPPYKSRGVGIRYADAAINELARIPLDDGLRLEAFDKVVGWINANR